MGIELKLQMRLGQRLVMTPMLQQAIKLLPMTRLELVQAIQIEIEQNPLLEEDTETEEPEEEENNSGDETKETIFEEQTTLEKPEKEKEKESEEIDWDAYMQSDLYDGRTGEGYVEFPNLENTLKQNESIEEHLMWQLSCSSVTEEEYKLGSIIVGNINNEGYLEESLENLAEEGNLPLDEMEDALILVQSLDPPGVGARNLKECLLLQLENNGAQSALMKDLINNHLEELDERNFKKLAKILDVSIDDILGAMKAMRELDPKPAIQFNPDEAHYITPDLYVVKMDNEYQVYLNDDDTPHLRINSYYKSILKNKSKEKNQEREYLENKFRSALWMIKSIEQRRQTMLKVGRSLCKFQREFLDKGLNYLKPLILKDVADDIEMHESTISRVTTNKYIYTTQGLFELKYFFHSSVGSYLGSDMSSVRVKEMIRVICKEEDQSKPYTDDQIVKLLQSKNVKIARRTVTKYRKDLKIPATSKRKRLFL
ncbi:MAG TPA: RNA polymerase sigma-54 factor [Nitrospirae bacterium]|nr:RNA polymerase sigma-54 factor [Nitrospirota bacterium]